MKNLTKKQYLRLSIALLIIGIAFMIWGGIIYRAYPQMHEARIIMRHATWHAGLQYGIGFIAIIAGYIFVRKA